MEVCDVAREACMDPRFCDVRSWVAYAGDSEQRHWEAVGIVDVETMWCALGVDLGDPNWTSLSTFRRCLPDFYVHKKKERCVCKHCKKGRVCLDVAVTLVNLIRRGQRAQGLDTAQLERVCGFAVVERPLGE